MKKEKKKEKKKKTVIFLNLTSLKKKKSKWLHSYFIVRSQLPTNKVTKVYQ
jgi:hypothetical protein